MVPASYTARKIRPALRLLAVAAVASASAAQAAPRDEGWQFTLQPYLLAPAMDGSSGIAGLNVGVDVSRKDVISNLNIGFLGYVEAARGDWAIGVDTNYMNLDATPDDQRISANISQTAVQPMVFYRISPNFELMGGIRYNSIGIEFEFENPNIASRSRRKDWVDPIIGARVNLPIGGRNSFSFLGNIGGFGVGSDISLQVRPMLNFGISGSTTIDVGYQWVYMDYESGSGLNRFAYDVMTEGPILGITFTF